MRGSRCTRKRAPLSCPPNGPRCSRRSAALGRACRWLLAGLLAANAAAAQPAAQANYARYCASCHGADRLGASGPALLPQSLARLSRERAARMIAEGLPATRMPGYAGTLSEPEIEALVALIYSAPAAAPVWDEPQIRASRIVHRRPDALPARPVHGADPLNLFVVVESGDHHVTILDGDRFEPVARFPSRYALHGGPKFSPDGRFVYFASRDGWVSQYDLWSLQLVAEIRAGLNTRNAAVSSDGRYVMVANYLPHTLVVLDAAGLGLLQVIEVRDERGRGSRVSAVYDAAPRGSFVAALKDIAEVWELPYRGARGAPLAPRRLRLAEPLDDFFFAPGYAHLIGAAREGGRGQVVSLEAGRAVAEVPLPGLPHLGSGIAWRRGGRTLVATPNLKDAVVSVIDAESWTVVKHIATLGPGFFLRSHEATPYAWTDAFNSAHRDTLQVIDKERLEVVASLTPAPGKTAAHVEFTRDGRYALASVWEMDGALVVYDARTLEEVKRLPMAKPSGKYNVYNKITRSSGTSH